MRILKNQTIQNQYLSQTASTSGESNRFYDSEQNISVLLFGITLDDVSEMCIILITFSGLTNFLPAGTRHIL
jgi:hypothetical protein